MLPRLGLFPLGGRKLHIAFHIDEFSNKEVSGMKRFGSMQTLAQIRAIKITSMVTRRG